MNQPLATDVVVMSASEFDKKLSETVEAAVKKAFESFSKPVTDTDGLIDKKKAADFLDCSVTTIDNLRRSGQIRAYKLGKKVLFKKSELSLTV